MGIGLGYVASRCLSALWRSRETRERVARDNQKRGKHARLPERPDSNRQAPPTGASRPEFNRQPGIRPVVMPQQRGGRASSAQSYDRSLYGSGQGAAHPKKKGSRARKVLLGILAAFLVLVIGAAAAASVGCV